MSSEKQAVRLPSISDRLTLIGATGSGKTVAGLWHLSRQPIDAMPWLVIDYKGDENINTIPYAQHVALGAPLLNGVYIVHPMLRDKDELEDYLWQVWSQEDTGIMVDEGFMLSDSEAFNTILMQGRSKRIPVIVCTQRPVSVSRFVFTEASFIQVFRVIDKRDRKTIAEFTPIFQPATALRRVARASGTREQKQHEDWMLPPFYSYYYDVARHKLTTLKPVDTMQKIRGTFSQKLKPVIEERQRMRTYI
jgi:hypothetical protein